MTDSSVNDADFRTTLECAQRFAESLCSVMNVLRAAVCAIQETAVVAWLPIGAWAKHAHNVIWPLLRPRYDWRRYQREVQREYRRIERRNKKLWEGK